MGKLINQIAKLQNYELFADLHWSGSFEDYLGLVRENPEITRTSFQRLYDMVLSYGAETYQDNKMGCFHMILELCSGGQVGPPFHTHTHPPPLSTLTITGETLPASC